MPTWIKLKLIERPYYDPRDGKVLTNIEGRRNRPKVDPFEGGGKVYPEEALKLKRLSWQERGTTLMLLVDEPQGKVNALKAMKGKATYRASPKVTREYDLTEHAPAELDDTQALRELKEIGLPKDTTLGADKRPIIPKENENETPHR